jgi:hypothetical protein
MQPEIDASRVCDIVEKGVERGGVERLKNSLLLEVDHESGLRRDISDTTKLVKFEATPTS